MWYMVGWAMFSITNLAGAITHQFWIGWSYIILFCVAVLIDCDIMRRKQTRLIDLCFSRQKIRDQVRVGSLRLDTRGDVTYAGDWILQHAQDKTWIMPLSRARGAPERFFARRMRNRILRRARKHRVNVVPVSEASFRQSRLMRHSVKLIHRQGLECVFTGTVERYYGNDDKKGYYLSGWDAQEASLRSRGLYFLTQLPRAVTTVAEAREALKPQSVIEAERKGRKVYRQGDMFAFPADLTDYEVHQEGEVTERVMLGGNLIAGQSLYGTAHTADKVATLPNGVQLAWGRLHHNPSLIGEQRGRDHRPRRLKRNRWHIVVKNTTPMK